MTENNDLPILENWQGHITDVFANPDRAIIYHFPCYDGFTSAWIGYRKLLKRTRPENISLIPHTYTDQKANNWPHLKEFTGKTVYFLDYSWPEDKMRDICSVAEQVIILDHHKTAYNNLKPLFEENLLSGIFDMSHSGAGLAWNHFHPNETMPMFVEYIQDRDLWKFKLPDSKEINKFIMSFDYDWNKWDELRDFFRTPTNSWDAAKQGAAIQRMQDRNMDEIIKDKIIFMKLGNYEVPTVNVNYFMASEICHLICEEFDVPFAAAWFYQPGGIVQFSLRSNGFDVEEIAKQFGGGGHAKAAGFEIGINQFHNMLTGE